MSYNSEHAREIVDGAVKISVAFLEKYSIPPADVPGLVRQIGLALADGLYAGHLAISGQAPATAGRDLPESLEAAAADVNAATAAGAAPAAEAEQPAAESVPPAAETAEMTAEETSAGAAVQADASPEAQEAPAAEEAAPAEAQEAVAATAEEPKKKRRSRKPRYKFAHLDRAPVMDPEEAIRSNAVVCLIDGKERRMLSRYLLAEYGMTPDEYRTHFKLRADYPMTAPGYAAEKRMVAIAQELGKNKPGRTKKATPATAKEAAPAGQETQATAEEGAPAAEEAATPATAAKVARRTRSKAEAA